MDRAERYGADGGFCVNGVAAWQDRELQAAEHRAKTESSGLPISVEFGFTFTRSEAEWRWTVFDASGGVAATGSAPTRAVAAARVIRELTRA